MRLNQLQASGYATITYWWLSLQLTAGLLTCGALHAATLGEAAVSNEDGLLILHADLFIPAKVSTVRTILTRYADLPDLNPNIRHVEFLNSSTPDSVRMRVTSKICVLIFCRQVNWTQDVHMPNSGEIVAHFDPTTSDFREGWVRYKMLAEAGGTRLIVDAKLRPNFANLPGLGPVLMKRKMRQDAMQIAFAIEELAHAEFN